MLRAGEGELLGREIAERVDRPAGGLQAPQQRDILLDRAVEGLDPALVEQAQFAGKFGKGLGPRLDRGGEVGRGVGWATKSIASAVARKRSIRASSSNALR